MKKIIYCAVCRHVCSILVLMIVASGFIVGATTVDASTIAIAPLSSGVFLNGDGANSSWVQVRNDWQGSNAFSQLYGGISSLADAQMAIGLSSDNPDILRNTAANMSTINAGNDLYNQLYAGSWGAANMPPLFTTGDSQQENFVGHVWGYLSVPTSGDYNFGVLYDDGFKFTLGGSDTSVSISVDGLNPRDRKGFDSNLSLAAGMYSFDLLGYNRLESGVLSLGWWYGDGETASKFETIQQANLFTSLPVNPSAVPLPSAVWLFGSGIIGLLSLVHRRRVN